MTPHCDRSAENQLCVSLSTVNFERALMRPQSIIRGWFTASSRRISAGLCLMAAVSSLTLGGCDSGSNTVPMSASTEQIQKVEQAQMDAAAEEMARQPGK
jgi:hypothetical protein